MLSGLSKGYQNKLKAIYNHFGADAQASKLLEELEEAETAIKNYRMVYCSYGSIRKPNDTHWRVLNESDLLEEITDCYVVATQLNKVDFTETLVKHIGGAYFENGLMITRMIKKYRISEVLEIAKEKIDRTIKRYDITV